jgi:hypothetical protein
MQGNSKLLRSDGGKTSADTTGTHASSEIFAALEEISSYGLAGDDTRAIIIQSLDNGPWFRSYLRIPRILKRMHVQPSLLSRL